VAAAAEGGAGGDRADGGADGEPMGVAFQAQPETAAFCGGEGGVAFTGERRDFCSVVGGVLLGGGQAELAGAAVLDVVVEGREIGGRNYGGGRSGGVCGGGLLGGWGCCGGRVGQRCASGGVAVRCVWHTGLLRGRGRCGTRGIAVEDRIEKGFGVRCSSLLRTLVLVCAGRLLILDCYRGRRWRSVEGARIWWRCGRQASGFFAV
jgi:hypothetical protein